MMRKSLTATCLYLGLGLALLAGCKHKDSEPGPAPNTSATGVPDVITVVSDGDDQAHMTFTYNSSRLISNLAFKVQDSLSGNLAATYNGDYTLNQVAASADAYPGITATARYQYEGGKLRRTVTQVPLLPYGDTVELSYTGDRVTKQLHWTGSATFDAMGQPVYTRVLDSTAFTYGGDGKLASSNTYAQEAGSGKAFVTTTTRTYSFNADGRLTSVTRQAQTTGQPSDLATLTQFFYPTELLGTPTDTYLKSNLFTYANIAPDVPAFLASTMGVGLLFAKPASPGDPYENPYVVTKVTIDGKDGYKVTSVDQTGTEAGANYVQIKLK